MTRSSVDTSRPVISPAALSALGPPLAGASESISSMKITEGAAARAAANTPCGTDRFRACVKHDVSSKFLNVCNT